MQRGYRLAGSYASGMANRAPVRPACHPQGRSDAQEAHRALTGRTQRLSLWTHTKARRAVLLFEIGSIAWSDMNPHLSNTLTQRQCNAISNKLNNRPRKRHDYRTPAELFNEK